MLILVLVLVVVVFGMTVIKCIEHPTAVGIRIRLELQDVILEPSPGLQPVHVRVELSDSGEPRLFVNYHPIAPHDFDAVLLTELKQRPVNWPVYVEGDPEMEWGVVVQTMVRIRSLGAEVTLLTTKRHRIEPARPKTAK